MCHFRTKAFKRQASLLHAFSPQGPRGPQNLPDESPQGEPSTDHRTAMQANYRNGKLPLQMELLKYGKPLSFVVKYMRGSLSILMVKSFGLKQLKERENPINGGLSDKKHLLISLDKKSRGTAFQIWCSISTTPSYI